MGALSDLQDALSNASQYDPSTRDYKGARTGSDYKNSISSASLAQQYLEKNNLLAAQYENINNKDLFDYQFGKENERQNWLLQHQKAVEVSALRQAGLNPALAGGGVTPATVNNPSPSAPSQGGSAGMPISSEMQGISSLVSGISQGGSNIANMFSQWAKLPNEAKSAKSVAQFDKWHAALEKKQVGWFDRQAEANVNMTNAQASQYLQQARWLDADTYVKFNKLPAEMKVLGATAAQMASQAGLNEQKAKESVKLMEQMDSLIDLNDASKKELYARMATYASQIMVNKSQANLNNRLGSPAKWLNETLGDIAGDVGNKIGSNIGKLWDKFIGLFN